MKTEVSIHKDVCYTISMKEVMEKFGISGKLYTASTSTNSDTLFIHTRDEVKKNETI